MNTLVSQRQRNFLDTIYSIVSTTGLTVGRNKVDSCEIWPSCDAGTGKTEQILSSVYQISSFHRSQGSHTLRMEEQLVSR